MTGFEILDLVIGMIFVYFLLSLICVSLQEAHSRFRKLRMKNLKKWLIDNLNEDGKKLGERLWCNLMVESLTQNNRGPSYLSKNAFISALLDEIHYGVNVVDVGKTKTYSEEKDKPYDFDSIKDSIKSSPLLPTSFRRVLLQFHSESYNNLETLKLKIGQWFDEAMERNAGTYKVHSQNHVMIISLLITVFINVDSIKLFRYFYENREQTAKVADAAQQLIQDPKMIQHMKSVADTSNQKASIDSIMYDIRRLRQYHHDLTALGLPIGWVNMPSFEATSGSDLFWYWLRTVVGWIVTAFAVSLGAPFWFDILNKMVNIRSAGKKPDDIKSNDLKSGLSTTENALA